MGNAVGQMVNKFGASVIGLFLTPFIVARIGLVQFGLFELVLNVIQYVSLADPGIGSMLIRYAAKHRAADEMHLVGRILVLGMFAYLVIGVVLSPLGLLLIPLLARNLHIPHSDLRLATTVLLLGYCYFFLSSATSLLSCALTGLGDLWIASMIDLGSRLAYAVLVLILLAFGGDVLSVVMATYIQMVVSMLAIYWPYRRRHGSVFGNPLRLKWSHIKEMLQFGGWVQLATLADIATTETDPLVIGAAFSVADVGIYSFADTIAGQIQFLPLALFSPILASATSAFQLGKDDQVRRLSVDGNRLLSFLGFAIGGMAAGLGPTIFRGWLGRSYPNLDVFLIFLVLIYSIRNLATVGFSIGSAIGRPDLAAKNLVFGTMTNVVGTVALALLFGLRGVVAGSLLGAIVRTGVFELRFHRLMGLRLWEDLFNWLWRLVAGVSVAGITIRLVSIALPRSWEVGRTAAIVSLPPLGLLYALVLVVALRATRFLQPCDARAFSPYLPRPLRLMLDSGVGRIVFGHRRSFAGMKRG